jgi:hypothetical protein
MEILCAYEQTHVMPALPTEPLFAYIESYVINLSECS